MILHGDCINKIKELDDISIDAIVTDPPYELGFMGKKWDASGISYNVELWKECLRVLKPGGHLLSFGGTRTYHRMTCGIEDAGFEIRDTIMWLYGSGFPKSHNIGKSVEKKKVGGIKNLKQIGTRKGIKVETGTQGFSYNKEYVAGKCMGGKQIQGQIPVYEINNEWDGWGTALKPAHEPIVMARKPLSEKTIAKNVLKWGTGGINIDECRVGFDMSNKEDLHAIDQWERQSKSGVKVFNQEGTAKLQEFNQKAPQGRFPANLIHDGSDEVVRLFPDTKSGSKPGQKGKALIGSEKGETRIEIENAYGDSGSAARFFYCAKASKKERNAGCEKLDKKRRAGLAGSDRDGNLDDVSERWRTQPAQNNHPTVKPIKLMEYLVRLVSKKGDTVLDPFMGSGTTGVACKQLDRNFIGIELNEEYIVIAEKRIAHQPIQKEMFT